MAIYMQWDSGSIKGDATQSKHADWIEVSSLQWGVGRGIHTAVGHAQNREASEPSVSEVTITKPFDSASVLLCQESVKGTEGKTVKLDFVRTDKDGGSVYLQITLSETLVSGYSVSTGGDRPSESISLNFTKIEYNESGPNQKNGAGQPVKMTYDLATAT